MKDHDKNRPGSDHDSDARQPEVDDQSRTTRLPATPNDKDFDTSRTVAGTPGDETTPCVGGVPTSSRHSFRAGDLVADRYRVVRFLARGGMGEVYEVEDQELGEPVALKTILPEIAANPLALGRFRRETLLARKVTHPNVCRIFDIGRHSPAEGDDITFLTMELLSGESLSSRLRRGTMKVEEALPLIRDIAAGLGAAHRAGIVHRDLKPANIFLVPDGDDIRAVVTDFGLARTDASGKALAEVTGTGEVLGTPAYMAPEQLEGQTPTAGTDLYALGLVMYEMLTGVKAFEGDTAFQIALQRLQGPPTPPSVHLPAIKRRWEDVILRCLEIKPEDRFQGAEEIVPALTGETLVVQVPSRRGRGWWRSPYPYVAGALVAALLVLGTWWKTQNAPIQSKPRARTSVAVLGFGSNSPQSGDEWISTALSEILTTDLGAGQLLRTIPGETVARAKLEIGVTEGQTLGSGTLDRLRENLGVDLVVVGSYAVAGSQIRLDLTAQDTRSSEPVAQVGVTGSKDDVFGLAAGVAADLREDIRAALDLDMVDSGSGGMMMASLPKSPVAARLYAQGVAKLRAFDPLTAAELLRKAAEEDPESPLVYSELANAWQRLGYDARAIESARRAWSLCQDLDLSQEEKLRVKAQYLSADSRWDDAVSVYGSLWQFVPDNLEYGLQLATAQIRADRTDAALKTVDEMRDMAKPASEDPRIDLIEARIQSSRGDFTKAETLAARAVELGRSREADLLVADALHSRAGALIHLGRYDEAEAASLEALGIQQRAGNFASAAEVMYQLGSIKLYKGEHAEALDQFNRALSVAQEIGNKRVQSTCVNSIGVALFRVEGDLKGAREKFEEALAIAEEIGNSAGAASALNNIAVMYQRDGQVHEAIDALQRALAIQRQRHDRYNEAMVLSNIASNFWAAGDVSSARDYFEQAIAGYRECESVAELANALQILGDVLMYQGDFEGALARHEEARRIRASTGNAQGLLSSELALLLVRLQRAILEGEDLGEFETRLQELADRFDQEPTRSAADRATALFQLADLRLEQGRVEKAGEAISACAGLVDQVGDYSTRFLVELHRLRVRAASGDQTAIPALEDALARAENESVLGLEFESRLALAEARLRFGQIAQGRRSLEELIRDANSRGWILFAKRAGSMLSRSETGSESPDSGRRGSARNVKE